MKVITCAGYYRTGSSAVTDFFGEFDNCKSLGTTEVRFLQDPDGVTALEMNIIEHPHRHNTSHAIKRFLKYSKFENGNIFSRRYRKLFGNEYLKITDEYINDITECKCHTLWRYDKIERGELFYMVDALVETLYSKIFKDKRTSLLTNEYGYYTAISKEEFYRATKKYTSRLLQATGIESDYLMVDQLAAPTDVNRYMNYVDDLYVIIVERDPRDLFILEKTKYRWGVIPYQNVKEFCEWYRITRSHRKNEVLGERVVLIYLEDMIYHYNETEKKLIDFVGNTDEHHVDKMTLFVPEVSKKGTRLWEQHPELEDEVRYIEKHLSEYLYHY